MKFKSYICNGCNDLLIMFIKLRKIAILNINSVTSGISKSEAINVIQNPNLSERKMEHYRT